MSDFVWCIAGILAFVLGLFCGYGLATDHQAPDRERLERLEAWLEQMPRETDSDPE